MPKISAETPGSSSTDFEGVRTSPNESSSTTEIGEKSTTALRENPVDSELLINYTDETPKMTSDTANDANGISTNAEYDDYYDEDVQTATDSLSKSNNDWVKLSPSQAEKDEMSDQLAATTDPLADKEVFHSLEDASLEKLSSEEIPTLVLAEEQNTEDPEWIDILGNGDIRKKTVVPGIEKTRPDRGQIVTVNLKGRLVSQEEVENMQNFNFTLGDADVIQGLELAIPLMNKQETAIIEIKSRFAYGSLGRRPLIPPDSTIIYTVELLDVKDEPDFETIPLDEKMRIGSEKKDRGNFWFARGDYSQSVVCYRRALDFLDDESQNFQGSPECLQEMLEDRLKVYNNLALAQLKLDAFDAAMKSVDNVLRVQPQNVKALFRKGKIYAAQGCVDEAICYMKKALKLEPETKIIHQELARLTAKKTSESISERELYRKMLGEQRQNVGKKKSNSHFKFWGSFLGGIAAVVIGVVAYRQYHGGW